MEEIKDLIEKEDYDKYKKLLQEFECKAIDTIETLTWQFKEELAEEIDDKIKGWKKESERLLKENWVKDDKIKKLEQELAKLKEKAIVSKFKKGQKVWIIWDEYNEEQDCIIYEIYQKTIGFFNYTNIDDVPFFEYAVLNNVKDNTVFGYINEPYIFLTEQEAQAKLKEIQGNE